MEIFNPIGFNPTLLFPKNSDSWDGMRRFVGMLCERYIAYDLNYVRVHSMLLESVYFSERKYSKIVNAMDASGVIERDLSYKVGEYSRGYRLSARFRKQAFEFVEVDAIEEVCVPKSQLETVLLENFKRVTVDLANAMKDKVSMRGIYSLMLMQKGKWYSHCDEFGKRLHNNIVNMPKDTRQYLSVDGVKLVNLDNANSQPLILGIEIRDRINLLSPLYGYPSPSPCNVPTINHIELTESVIKIRDRINLLSPLPPSPCNVPTINHYIELTESGNFYHYLSTKLNMPVEKIKKNLFSQWLFCKKHYGIGKEMEKLFPDVTAEIVEMKKRDYKNVARLLQRRESDIMIRGVCLTLMSVYPHIWFAPIHDSILTTPDNADAVQHVITQEFKNYNATPTIRVTAY